MRCAERDIVFNIIVCLSVRLSVRLSNTNIVPKRMHISSQFLTIW